MGTTVTLGTAETWRIPHPNRMVESRVFRFMVAAVENVACRRQQGFDVTCGANLTIQNLPNCVGLYYFANFLRTNECASKYMRLVQGQRPFRHQTNEIVDIYKAPISLMGAKLRKSMHRPSSSQAKAKATVGVP